MEIQWKNALTIGRSDKLSLFWILSTFAIFIIESINTSIGIDSFLCTTIEGMADSADFNFQSLALGVCRFGCESIATCARYCNFVVIAMDVFCHDKPPFGVFLISCLFFREMKIFKNN
jgi:hypothetical protein